MARDHLNALSLLQEGVLFSNANLTEYYDHYRAGIAHNGLSPCIRGHRML